MTTKYLHVWQERHDAQLRAIFAQRGVEDAELIEEVIALSMERAGRYHDALSDVEVQLLEVGCYRNMKAFPILQDVGKRAANTASAAMGRVLPFPDHRSADLVKSIPA